MVGPGGKKKEKEEREWSGPKARKEKERVLHFSEKGNKQIQFEFKFIELKFKLNYRQ